LSFILDEGGFDDTQLFLNILLSRPLIDLLYFSDRRARNWLREIYMYLFGIYQGETGATTRIWLRAGISADRINPTLKNKE
jgi:hypothetical protein